MYRFMPRGTLPIGKRLPATRLASGSDVSSTVSGDPNAKLFDTRTATPRLVRLLKSAVGWITRVIMAPAPISASTLMFSVSVDAVEPVDGLIVGEQRDAIDDGHGYPFPHLRPGRRSARATSCWMSLALDPKPVALR